MSQNKKKKNKRKNYNNRPKSNKDRKPPISEGEKRARQSVRNFIEGQNYNSQKSQESKAEEKNTVNKKSDSNAQKSDQKTKKKKSTAGIFWFIVILACLAVAAVFLVQNYVLKDNGKNNESTLSESKQSAEISETEIAAATTDVPQTEVTTTVTISVSADAKSAAIDMLDLKEDISQKKKINVEPILQMPELPTGCEITSLTMVLDYYGYNVDKITMADNYLIKEPDSGDNNLDFNTAFIGDPKNESSFGCFAPVIQQTAENFFKSRSKKMNAADISGLTLQQLFHYVDKGYPLVVWATISLMEPEWHHYWTKSDGTEVYFPSQEHCVVLTGYDLDKGIVYIDDPLKGAVEYDMDDFEKVYDQMKKQAVLIF